MDIMREIVFVLLILAPLCLAIPLTVRCWRSGARPQVVYGLLAACVAFGIWTVISPLTIGATYWRVGYVVAIAVGLYATVGRAHRPWARLRWAACLLGAGVLACILVYTSCAGYRDHARDPGVAMRRSIRNHLMRTLMAAAADRTFPAGYLTAGSPILRALPAAERAAFADAMSDWGSAWEIVPRWHTPLTGLYRRKLTPVRLWYPGGRVRDTLEQLEWRPLASE